MKTTEQRFWDKVAKSGPEDCWPWIAVLNHGGYGMFRSPKWPSMQLAHRFSWMLHNNYAEIPTGMVIMHHCDNRKCVNPAHLSLGTHFENNLDMRAKNRDAIAHRHGKAVLNRTDVKFIRHWANRGFGVQEIADAFGITNGHVSQIKNRNRWASA